MASPISPSNKENIDNILGTSDRSILTDITPDGKKGNSFFDVTDDGVSKFSLSQDSLVDSPSQSTSTPKRQQSPHRLSLDSNVVRTLDFDDDAREVSHPVLRTSSTVFADLNQFESQVASIRDLPPDHTMAEAMESFQFHLPPSSDLSEQLEAETARRSFCEGKIVELQSTILTLEQTKFVLTQNCQKKSQLLSNVSQMISRIKDSYSESDQKQRAKISQIERGNAQLMDVMREMELNQDQLKKRNALTENELEKTKLNLTKSLESSNQQTIELNTVRSKSADLSSKLSALEVKHSDAVTGYETKISNVKRLLENERAKVAKVERSSAVHDKKMKQIQQQFELLKLQTDQAKSAREQQSRLLNVEKENRNRMKSEYEEQITDLRNTIATQKTATAALEKSLEIEKTSGEAAKRQSEALKAESELTTARYHSEKSNIETYHTALLEKKLTERDVKCRNQIASIQEKSSKYETVTVERIQRLEDTHKRQITELEESLQAQYQSQIKKFLQHHFHQGLSALSMPPPSPVPVPVSLYQPAPCTPVKQSFHDGQTGSVSMLPRRSSSPVSSTTKPPSNLDDISHIESVTHSSANQKPRHSREAVLRNMIQQLLKQQPIRSPDDSDADTSRSGLIQSHLQSLAHSDTLTDKERKSIEKLFRIMNQKSNVS